MIDATLIFPPLVETSFGRYYPSLPVLSGVLESVGFKSQQIDLNENFAEHLLSGDRLNEMGEGDFGCWGVRERSDQCCVAARLLSKNPRLLYNDFGEHRFRTDENQHAYLLHQIAREFSVDLDLESAIELAKDDPRSEYWASFATEQLADVCDRLGSSKLVGISIAMGPQLFPSLCIAIAIRTLAPTARIVCGGAAMSLLDESGLSTILSEIRAIDAIVRFEGELVVREMARQLSSGIWDPSCLPNTSFHAECSVEHNQSKRSIRLSDSPFPDYRAELLTKLAFKEVSVIQARGCYWGKCSYCDFVELYKGDPAVRFQRPSRLVEEIEFQIVKHGIGHVELVTEAIPPAVARRLSVELIQKRLDVSWSSFAMVDPHFDVDTLRVMAESGCKTLVVGIETFIDRVLRLVEKRATCADNIEFIRRCYDAGIRLSVNLIPDLPSTTYKEALDGLSVVRKLAGQIAGVSIFPFEATVSSAIGRAPETYGLIPEFSAIEGQSQFAANHLKWRDPAMTDSERAEVIAAYEEFAFEVNSDRIGSTGEVITGTECLEIDGNAIDIVLVKERDQFQITSLTGGSRFKVSPELAVVISGLARLTTFRVNAGPLASLPIPFRQALVAKLLELGVLEVVK